MLSFFVRYGANDKEEVAIILSLDTALMLHTGECSLQDHGNPKYGAPTPHVPKYQKSRQGKMEKSFLTFVATYPTWQPGPAGEQGRAGQ